MFLFLSPLFAYLFSEEEYLESLSSPPTRKGSLLLFIECLERLWDVVGENVSWCLWLFALVVPFFFLLPNLESSLDKRSYVNVSGGLTGIKNQLSLQPHLTITLLHAHQHEQVYLLCIQTSATSKMPAASTAV